MLQPFRKFSEKRQFSLNPIKIPLLGYFCRQIHSAPKWSQSLRFLRNMQKIVSSKISLSCFLDGKKPNIAKLVYINFLVVSMKIAMLQPVRKFSEKRLFSLNPIKIPLLGCFCMHNSFLHCKWSQSLRFLRNMQKIEKKYLLSLYSIFCDFLYQFQAKFPKTK